MWVEPLNGKGKWEYSFICGNKNNYSVGFVRLPIGDRLHSIPINDEFCVMQKHLCSIWFGYLWLFFIQYSAFCTKKKLLEFFLVESKVNARRGHSQINWWTNGTVLRVASGRIWMMRAILNTMWMRAVENGQADECWLQNGCRALLVIQFLFIFSSLHHSREITYHDSLNNYNRYFLLSIHSRSISAYS